MLAVAYLAEVSGQLTLVASLGQDMGFAVPNLPQLRQLGVGEQVGNLRGNHPVTELSQW
jgi:hypothetical protein